MILRNLIKKTVNMEGFMKDKNILSSPEMT